jgi:hypothetical protein
MTLLSSGTIALQNAGTNSTTTSANSLESGVLYRGQDTSINVTCQYEISGGDQFLNRVEWQGQVGGYQSGTSVSTRWMSGTSLPILSLLIDALPIGANGVRNSTPSFIGEPTSTFGSIGSTFYTDGAGNTRTIRAIIFGNPSSSPSPNDTRHWVIFVLNGTSVPNSDNTFKSLILTGSGTDYTFTRSGAHYSSSSNGCTAWAWEYNSTTSNNGIDSMYTSGTTGFEIMGPDTTVTVNNGIAEEMGGADSSNVRMSDYYSNGTFMGNVTGIPTSGQLKMSDFFGKTFVGQIFDHTTTLLPDYWAYSSGAYVTYYYNGFMSGNSTTAGDGDSLSDATFPNTGTITFGGLTRNANDVEITQVTFESVNNASSSTSFTMVLKDYSSDRGTSWTGTGFTNLEIYLDQSNTTGTPDLTLALADATATYSSQSTYTQINLHWAAADGGQQSYANYFGNSGTPATNGTQTLNITGLS